ncbi:hypothetical protein BaRGS_00005109, partial [Batillaria attramentaria]
VLRVGVTVFRFVSLTRARYWLTHTLKNNRGRGQACPLTDKDDDITVDDVANTTSAPAKHTRQTGGDTSPSHVVTGSSLVDQGALAGDRSKGGNTIETAGSAVTGDPPCDGSTIAAGGGRTEEREKGGKEKMADGEVSSAKPSRTRASTSKKPDEEGVHGVGVQPTSTYEKIRLVSRQWCKPEGVVNRPVLSEYLDTVLQFMMFNPGSSLAALIQRFHPIFSPFAMRELLEILEELGCVRKFVMPKRKPATLFSARRVQQDSSVVDMNSASSEELLFEVTVDCALRLGQFLNYMG